MDLLNLEDKYFRVQPKLEDKNLPGQPNMEDTSYWGQLNTAGKEGGQQMTEDKGRDWLDLEEMETR